MDARIKEEESKLIEQVAQLRVDAGERDRLTELAEHRRLFDACALHAMEAIVTSRLVAEDGAFNANVAKRAWDLAEAMTEERIKRREEHQKQLALIAERLSAQLR